MHLSLLLEVKNGKIFLLKVILYYHFFCTADFLGLKFYKKKSLKESNPCEKMVFCSPNPLLIQIRPISKQHRQDFCFYSKWHEK